MSPPTGTTIPAAAPGELVLGALSPVPVGVPDPVSLDVSVALSVSLALDASLALPVSAPVSSALLLSVALGGAAVMLPASMTSANGALPSSVAQQPKNDFPPFAPALSTMTPVLQNPWSQNTDVDAATTFPAEHEVKKSQGAEAAQHVA